MGLEGDTAVVPILHSDWLQARGTSGLIWLKKFVFNVLLPSLRPG